MCTQCPSSRTAKPLWFDEGSPAKNSKSPQAKGSASVVPHPESADESAWPFNLEDLFSDPGKVLKIYRIWRSWNVILSLELEEGFQGPVGSSEGPSEVALEDGVDVALEPPDCEPYGYLIPPCAPCLRNELTSLVCVNPQDWALHGIKTSYNPLGTMLNRLLFLVLENLRKDQVTCEDSLGPLLVQPDSPQSNGRCEAAIGALKRATRVRLQAAELPSRFWALAMVPAGESLLSRQLREVGLPMRQLVPFGNRVHVMERTWQSTAGRKGHWSSRVMSGIITAPSKHVTRGYVIHTGTRDAGRLLVSTTIMQTLEAHDKV